MKISKNKKYINFVKEAIRILSVLKKCDKLIFQNYHESKTVINLTIQPGNLVTFIQRFAVCAVQFV